MANSLIPKPINETELWHKGSGWNGFVQASKIRAGYDIDQAINVIDLIMPDDDIQQFVFCADRLEFRYRHNNQWQTIATWTKD